MHGGCASKATQALISIESPAMLLRRSVLMLNAASSLVLAAAAPPAFTADDANKAFTAGTASNDLSAAGLLMHQFDYEFPMTRWQPCTVGGAGWCPYDDRVSGLLVNKQISTSDGRVNLYTSPSGGGGPLGNSMPGGVILAPKVAKVLCSYSADGGT